MVRPVAFLDAVGGVHRPGRLTEPLAAEVRGSDVA
jgi:hypothetical protein